MHGTPFTTFTTITCVLVFDPLKLGKRLGYSEKYGKCIKGKCPEVPSIDLGWQGKGNKGDAGTWPSTSLPKNASCQAHTFEYLNFAAVLY